MPSSSKQGKSVIREWLEEFNKDIKTVIDLGVGKGTYYKLFVEKSKILSNAYWIGIEVWEPYIKEFNLVNRYNKIINKDIRQINFLEFNNVDLVFAGDILEHITKDDAVKLINDLLVVSNRIIISIPIVHYPQGEEEGNPYEVHVKDDWSHEEVLESFPKIKKHWQGSVIGVYLLEK